MKLVLVDTFEELGSTSPLGLISIATYLREKAGFQNTIIADVAVENVIQKIMRIKPDAVGISAYTYKYNSAISLAKEIKKVFSIPVFVGGPHISLAPQTLNPTFDFGVIGEGEQTMLEILNALEYEMDISKIRGLVYCKNGELKLTEARPLIEPLDNIPIPDRDFTSKEYFLPVKSFDGRNLVEGNLLTSRGCPYRCPFCASSQFWKTVRLHSVKRIVDEVSYLKEKYKIDCINVWDDFFTMSKRRARSIVQALKNNGLTEEIEYRVQVRVNTFDEEMATLLKSMNVTNLNFGFESGSQRILNFLKKEVTIQQIKEVVVRGKKHGMAVTGSIIFGSPNETLEDMKLTLKLLDYMHKHSADCIWFFTATPYPGTVWWKYAEADGKVSDDMDWDLLDLRKHNNPLLLDASVSNKEFQKIMQIADRKVTAYFKLHAKNRPLSKTIKRALTQPKRVLGTFYELLRDKLY